MRHLSTATIGTHDHRMHIRQTDHGTVSLALHELEPNGRTRKMISLDITLADLDRLYDSVWSALKTLNQEAAE